MISELVAASAWICPPVDDWLVAVVEAAGAPPLVAVVVVLDVLELRASPDRGCAGRGADYSL